MTKKSVDISVILPVYNAEKYLYDSIQSVLNQTFKNFELLIINDGSTDNSLEIIKEFCDSRIHYVENIQNLGLIKTLNKGIQLACGKYIARMDSDDICESNRFIKQFEFLEANPTYVLCGSWVDAIDSNGVFTHKIKRIDSSELIRVNMLFTTPFVHPSVMIRKEVLQHNPYNLEAKHCEDMELWPRLARNKSFKFKNLKECLLKYRIHESNISIVHQTTQNEMRIKILSPYTEMLIERKMSDEEKYIHFLSYHLKTETINLELLAKSKSWFEFLAEINKSRNEYGRDELNSLLYSRWIILCLKSRNIHKIFNINLSWYRPKVLLYTFRLLWNK